METQVVVEAINASTLIIILAVWLTYFAGKADLLEASGKEESARRYHWAVLILGVMVLVNVIGRGFL